MNETKTDKKCELYGYFLQVPCSHRVNRYKSIGDTSVLNAPIEVNIAKYL